MADLARLRRIFGHFDPDRLPSEEEYVDFGAARGEEVLDPLLQSLILASAERPIARLFGGGRGAGKTTELRRFETSLSRAGFFAVYLDVDRTLDVNNCDFADFIVAIAMGLRRQLAERNTPGYSNLAQYVESKVSEVVGFFGQQVRVPSAKLKGPAKGAEAEIEVRFERSRTARRALEDEFEALSTDAVAAVQELISKVADELVGSSYAGLVLLVDGGDKILPFRAGDDHESQHTKIFAKHATQLCALGCHTVYSVPLSFCYSPDAQSFNATSGAQPIVLPMTSLRGNNKSNPGPETQGSRLFRELISRRMSVIGESVEDVFEPAAVEQVILLSGGSPTALMTIVQEALVRNDREVPLRLDSVHKAVRSISNAMGRQVPPEYWNVLKSYVQPQAASERTAEFMDCLYYQYLYEYMNGGSWFEVNPVLKTLSQLSA
jgi:hypothetical protein